MAFKRLNESHVEVGRRVLVSGPPNSRKTSSLMTWPRPIHILSFPGEKGHSSIPLDEPGVSAYVWEDEDVTKYSPTAVVNEVESATWKILAGKSGEIVSFAGDGLHKLYGWYYGKARADLQASSNLPDDVIDARAYGLAHDNFTLYLTKVAHSTVPFVVFTVWEGKELDDSDAKKGPSHIYPDLPGKMAKRIMGEFSVVVYSEVGLPPAPDKPAPATWQLLPSGKVWGAGVKIPAKLAQKLPAKIAQDFPTLQKVLQGSK